MINIWTWALFPSKEPVRKWVRPMCSTGLRRLGEFFIQILGIKKKPSQNGNVIVTYLKICVTFSNSILPASGNTKILSIYSIVVTVCYIKAEALILITKSKQVPWNDDNWKLLLALHNRPFTRTHSSCIFMSSLLWNQRQFCFYSKSIKSGASATNFSVI